ncbi:hypothetical protein DF3PB_3010005 [uncultured Defluviicoccus sp.]|uniref:Polysaccharide chain length determinant N-terminal domain-containing protein n=1 Tax=metagenome TaxID=256318 RepID=A0A380TE96_9ZZZZ|nr:hypothetical protein DF3PB_3010005 [uncultured Defluviicoccus sp.]
MLYGRSRPLVLDLLLLIRRTWGIIIVSVAIGLAIALITSAVRQPVFETSAAVLLQLGRSAGSASGTDTRETAPLLAPAIKTEIEILNSRDLKQQVIERLGVETIYPSATPASGWRDAADWIKGLTTQPPDTGRIPAVPSLDGTPDDGRAADDAAPSDAPGTEAEGALARIQEALKVESAADSAVIHLRFEHPDREVGVRVLESLIDAYIAKRAGIHATPLAPGFVDRLQQYRERLIAAEDALDTFRQTNDVFDVEEQTRLLLAKSVDLEFQIRETATRLREMEDSMAIVANPAVSLSSLAPFFSDSEIEEVQRANQERMRLRVREAELLRKNARDGKKQRELSADIKRLNTYFEEQRDIGRKRLALEQKALAARKAALEADLVAARADIRRINRLSRPFKELRQAADRQEAEYNAYADRIETGGGGDSLEAGWGGRVRIIEEPLAASRPSGMLLSMRIVLGGVLGLIFGLALAVVVEACRVPLATPESVNERLGLPVLARIPNGSR